VSDDSWRDGYDSWKLRSPEDEYGGYYDAYDRECDCDHEDYDIDVCTGRASCNLCSHHWYLDSCEIDAELDRQARYHEGMEREERRHRRRQFWRRLTYPFRWPIFRMLQRIWPRKSLSVLTDDEIPF
jgi:hypothetical protein